MARPPGSSDKDEKAPMKWVTGEQVKVDRVACPWLIRTFIGPDTEFLFAPAADAPVTAEREGAVPYDVPNVEFGHRRATGVVPWQTKSGRSRASGTSPSRRCSRTTPPKGRPFVTEKDARDWMIGSSVLGDGSFGSAKSRVVWRRTEILNGLCPFVSF